MFRKSCGKCHFANIKRPSDITIADFWGIENVVPGLNNDDKGCSLVFLNTEKGKILFDRIKNKMNVCQVAVEDSLQPNLCAPSKLPKKRDKFEADYSRFGFKYVYYKYGNVGLYYKLKIYKSKIISLIRKKI